MLSKNEELELNVFTGWNKYAYKEKKERKYPKIFVILVKSFAKLSISIALQ